MVSRSGLLAQAPVEVARAESSMLNLAARKPALEAMRSHPLSTAKLGGDAEYGEQVVLTRKAHWAPWTLSLDAQYFYTDNVALASKGVVDDFYLRTSAVVQYTNRIHGDLFADAAISNSIYVHDRHSEFDFHFLRAEAGLIWQAPWLADSYFSLHYAWYRISESDFSTSAFENHAACLSGQKTWRISRGQQVFAGLNAELSIAADPESPRRDEYSAFMGYKLRVTEKFSVQASYRAGLYDYRESGRNDWNHTVALACSYDVMEWVRLQLAASGSWNRSSAAFFNYDNLVAGLGVSLHVEL